jgi:hypothetical protein
LIGASQYWITMVYGVPKYWLMLNAEEASSLQALCCLRHSLGATQPST